MFRVTALPRANLILEKNARESLPQKARVDAVCLLTAILRSCNYADSVRERKVGETKLVVLLHAM